MGPTNGTCILCGGTAEKRFIDKTRDTHFNCGVCGEFSVTDVFKADHLNTLEKRSLAALSAATRQSTQKLRLTNENWRGFRDAHLNVAVATKVEKLLEEFRRRSEFAGHYVDFEPALWYSLVDAAGAGECRFIADILLQSKLVDERAKTQGVQVKFG